MKEAGKHVGCDRTNISKHLKLNKLGNNTAIINDYILRYKICIDLDGEIWKNVNTNYPNIDDRYKVSNYARIKNEKEKILSPHTNPGGYSQITLSNYVKGIEKGDDSNFKSFYIHVLIAYAFLEFEGNRKEYQVNHKDKDPTNNNLDNLEILLIKDHAIKDRGKPVLCVTKDDKYYIFDSQSRSAYLPEMIVKSIHYAIKHKTNYKDHYWYDLNSEEARTIVEEFQSRGMNPSIPSENKSEIVSSSKEEIQTISITSIPIEEIRMFLSKNEINPKNDNESYIIARDLIIKRKAKIYTDSVIDWIIAHNLTKINVKIKSFSRIEIDSLSNDDLIKLSKELRLDTKQNHSIKSSIINVLQYLRKLT